MSNSNNNRGTSAGCGMDILGVLQIIFIVLKLVGVINWSWWLVLIPTWINLGLSLLLILILVIVLVIIVLRRNN